MISTLPPPSTSPSSPSSRSKPALPAAPLRRSRSTQACLDRIAIYNPRYNAIILLNPDALADARAIDRRRAAGEALGPLAGVPVVIKDPMDMVGFPTTAGWSLLHSKRAGVDLIPGIDSPVVARMRAAGA